MLSIHDVVLGYLVYVANPFFILCLFFQCFHIKYYIIDDRETVMRILKKINNRIISSSVKYVNGRDVPTEYFIGPSYVGYLNYSNFEPKMYIITRTSMFKELVHYDTAVITLPTEQQKDPDHKIKVYIRKGTYKNTFYQPITLNMNHLQPFPTQRIILDNIKDIYSKLGRATIFIHGVSYAGKSSIGYLLAKELHGHYCHSFNPSDPGDQLSNLIVDSQNEDEPLIIVLEESDIIIQNIHHQRITINHDIFTSVYNKSTWATFLDDMIFFNNVILILTSNTSKSTIDEMDESYLREGRIHASFSMMEKIMNE